MTTERRAADRRILDRFFRKVIAHAEGAVVHDGDCLFHDKRVCTCGLLHALLPAVDPDTLYPRFGEDFAAQARALERLP